MNQEKDQEFYMSDELKDRIDMSQFDDENEIKNNITKNNEFNLIVSFNKKEFQGKLLSLKTNRLSYKQSFFQELSFYTNDQKILFDYLTSKEIKNFKITHFSKEIKSKLVFDIDKINLYSIHWEHINHVEEDGYLISFVLNTLE